MVGRRNWKDETMMGNAMIETGMKWEKHPHNNMNRSSCTNGRACHPLISAFHDDDDYSTTSTSYLPNTVYNE